MVSVEEKDDSDFIGFRCPFVIKNAFAKMVSRRKVTMTARLINLMCKDLMENQPLNETEKEYVSIRSKDYELNMIKYLRSKSAERIMFLKNVERQFTLFVVGNKHINREELIKNMNLNLTYAETHEWKEEVEMIRVYISVLEDFTPLLSEVTKEMIEDKRKMLGEKNAESE